MAVVVVIQQSFLTSALALPKETTKKVFKALRNLVANPMAPGLHVERILEHRWSARVDDKYRIIYQQSASQCPILLFVGIHEDAYRWAGRTAAPCFIPSDQLPVQGESEPLEASLGKTAQLDDVEALVTRPKYLPLARFLLQAESGRIVLGFDEIERIIGQALPASAKTHRAWWGNESSGSHVQARAWLGVGRKVESIDLARRTVTFAAR